MAVLALAAIAGCGRQPYVNEQRLERGLVLVLPGIEGRSPLNEAICEGLDRGGVTAAIEICDWTSSWGPLYNLRAIDRNRRKAAEIAMKILDYRASHPSRPVVLVGHSGGGAMAAWVAECMPPDEPLDAVIMLSASLSPSYMLDVALANSRRGIVNFYSSRDWFFLGVGTTVAGTMDGEHTSSAGKTGFEIPFQSNPAVYRRLYQVSWNERMEAAGHVGMHVTSASARFASLYVAPLIMASTWDEEFIIDITQGSTYREPPP